MPGDEDSAAGAADLERAIERQLRISERKPHTFFGPMSRDEWDQINFRHAEMHLSFIVPD